MKLPAAKARGVGARGARLASFMLLFGRAATAMSNGRQNCPIPAQHCCRIGRLIACQEEENVEIGLHSVPAALVHGFRWRNQGANAGGAHHHRKRQSFHDRGRPQHASFGSPPEEAARGDRSWGYRPVRCWWDAPITRALRYCAMTSRPSQPVHTPMRSDPSRLGFRIRVTKAGHWVGRPMARASGFPENLLPNGYSQGSQKELNGNR
jgi:hypothetical protein